MSTIANAFGVIQATVHRPLTEHAKASAVTDSPLATGKGFEERDPLWGHQVFCSPLNGDPLPQPQPVLEIPLRAAGVTFALESVPGWAWGPAR